MLTSRLSHPSLEIFLLGKFHVKVDGELVEEHLWLRRSAKLLVKLLALKPQHQLHREQIIDLLWTEHDPETALNNLNKALYMARRALEPNLSKGSDSQFIRTEKQQIILHSPGSLFIDVDEFERLAALAIRNNCIEAGKNALKLYRGDLLMEDIYEDWLSARREALRILYRKVATKTAELYAQTGELQFCLELLEKLCLEEPTDECTHRQLMRIYAQTGNRYQALKQFEQCRTALHALGLEPEPETLKLEESIKTGKICLNRAEFEQSQAQQGQQQSLQAQVSQPRMRQISFQRGAIQSALFSPDNQTIVYSAAWEGSSLQLYATNRETGESRPFGLCQSYIYSISPTGEMAVALNRKFLRGYTSVGTLARLHLSGGMPRALYENVQWADWHPDKNCLSAFSDNQCLAVVRDHKGKSCLEYPIGKVLFETGGWISHPRFSPAGDKIAFIEHPTLSDDSGFVAIINLKGENEKEKRVLTGDWVSIQGLAWAGDEICFTAAREGNTGAIRALNLKGEERLIYRGIGSLTLHDNSKKGEALVTVDKTRIQIAARIAEETEERDLSWHDWSLARDLSDDGKTLLFTEAGESGGRLYATYLRKTDGSAALRLSSGSALALSPNGKLALVRITAEPQQLALIPTGAGETKLLAPLKSESFFYQPWACFFPCGKRILFAANEPDKGTQLYVQDIGGEPVCITPEDEGIEISSPHSISPDGEQVAIINSENSICLYEIENRKCTQLKNLEKDYLPVRWSGDGKHLFVRQRGQVPAVIYRYDLESGEKEKWLELMPRDRTGVHEILRVLLTPDGKSYAYSYTRELSDLYVIEGLQ